MIVMCSLLIAVRCYAGMRGAMSKISQYTLTTAMTKINELCRNIYTHLSTKSTAHINRYKMKRN